MKTFQQFIDFRSKFKKPKYFRYYKKLHKKVNILYYIKTYKKHKLKKKIFIKTSILLIKQKSNRKYNYNIFYFISFSRYRLKNKKYKLRKKYKSIFFLKKKLKKFYLLFITHYIKIIKNLKKNKLNIQKPLRNINTFFKSFFFL